MDLDEYQVQRVFGIPIEYFYEVDAACDAFFKRRGMVATPLREQIYREVHLGSEMKKARKRKAA